VVTPEPAASPAREPETATDAASTPMSITELQQRLSAMGYKPGPVDGVSGPRTASALRKFQHDHHLPVTGTLDPQTVAALRKP
jgi:peptidoglycan hydrolase-like protein with peptidoglycan-binding domain